MIHHSTLWIRRHGQMPPPTAGYRWTFVRIARHDPSHDQRRIGEPRENSRLIDAATFGAAGLAPGVAEKR